MSRTSANRAHFCKPVASDTTLPIGILSLQGDVAAHGRALADIGEPWIEVKKPAALDRVGGLILPGGESTTMLRAIREEGFWEPLATFDRPILATCAGVILLAREVRNPAQASLGRLDVAVVRNGYGRQNESFIDSAPVDGTERELVFIRAPRIVDLGPSVQILVRLRGEAIMVEEGGITACTFHPELSAHRAIHERFVRCARAECAPCDS